MSLKKPLRDIWIAEKIEPERALEIEKKATIELREINSTDESGIYNFASNKKEEEQLEKPSLTPKLNQKQTKTPVSLQKFIGKLRRRKITDKELSLEPTDQKNTSLNPSKSFTTVKLEHSADVKI